MEDKKPITADDYKNQPHLAEPGEYVVIHGLVYRVLRQTWKPMKTGKKGRAVKGTQKVPKDLILRLMGVHAPPEMTQPITPFTAPVLTPPDHDHGPEFVEREVPVPEVVQRDENVTLDPGINNGTLMVTPDVH